MDQGRGLLSLLAEISESAVQRGVQLAAGLSTGLESLDTDFAGRVSGMADDVVGQGRANTDLVVSLVRSEVDKAVARVGFVREEELAALRRHVERLEAALVDAGALAAPTSSKPSGKQGASTKPAAKKPAASKSAAKKPAKKSVSKKSATKPAAAAAAESTP